MPVPDQVRDDGSGIQNILESLGSGLRRNDALKDFHTFHETVKLRSGILQACYRIQNNVEKSIFL